MNEKKLIDLYKKQLAQSAEKAPEGLWDDIAKEMDENQLISQYKDELAQSAEKAPAGLWDDIARKMDIDEVWEGVAAGLEEEKRKGGFWWFNRGIAAAIAILLISTLSVWLAGNLTNSGTDFAGKETETIAPTRDENKQEKTSDTTAQTTSPEFRIAISGINEKDSPYPEVGITGQASIMKEDLVAQDESSSREILPGVFVTGELASVDFLYGREAKVATSIQPSLVLDVPEPVLSSVIGHFFHVSPYASSGSFALGFTTAMKNTWLFNHETFQGFNPGSGSRTHVQIYPDIAVSIRYLLNARWKMESNLSFSSSAGQSYEQYIYGRYSQREISLNYFYAEVLTGYNHSKRRGVRSNNIFHSTSLGLYYGILNAANESIAGEKEDVSTLYRKDDYGIVAGHNLNIPIVGNLIFSPGLYITWGMPNIYQGEYILPSLKRTHNRSAELRFSLYYNFRR